MPKFKVFSRLLKLRLLYIVLGSRGVFGPLRLTNSLDKLIEVMSCNQATIIMDVGENDWTEKGTS